MALFATAAVNKSLPIAADYVAAAQQIDMGCGPGFVSAAIPAPRSLAGPKGAPMSVGWSVALVVAVVVAVGLGGLL